MKSEWTICPRCGTLSAVDYLENCCLSSSGMRDPGHGAKYGGRATSMRASSYCQRGRIPGTSRLGASLTCPAASPRPPPPSVLPLSPSTPRQPDLGPRRWRSGGRPVPGGIIRRNNNEKTKPIKIKREHMKNKRKKGNRRKHKREQ